MSAMEMSIAKTSMWGYLRALQDKDILTDDALAYIFKSYCDYIEQQAETTGYWHGKGRLIWAKDGGD